MAADNFESFSKQMVDQLRSPPVRLADFRIPMIEKHMRQLDIPVPEFPNPARDTVESLQRCLDEIGRTLDPEHEAGLSVAEDGRRFEIAVRSIKAVTHTHLIVEGIDADGQRVWFHMHHAQSVTRIVAIRKREETQNKIGF